MTPVDEDRLPAFLNALDRFIAEEITPLQHEADNMRFFDHRREWARTDFEDGGTPREEWEELLAEARRRADAAGFYRFGLPVRLGGQGGTNVEMAAVREHLARAGLGLHNDLQNEHSVVGNLVFIQMLDLFGSPEQCAEHMEATIVGEHAFAFAMSEPDHGSDATWMETTAVRHGDTWTLNGRKRWVSGAHTATHFVVLARTSGNPGDAAGLTAFLVPRGTEGMDIPFYWWTFNMPSDHAEFTLDDVVVPDSAILGQEGEALDLVQSFVHENRIRQAASSVGAARFCIDQAVERARERVTFGRPLASRQAIQWPLVELHTDAEALTSLIHRTARQMDEVDAGGGSMVSVGHYVSMCNYRGNRLACDAADQAMQVFGGLGYSRHEPFEHIYRHHRRYRITEGSEEMQIRRVAGQLFGFL